MIGALPLLILVFVGSLAAVAWAGFRVINQVRARQPPSAGVIVTLGLSLAIIAQLATALAQVIRSGLHMVQPRGLLWREQLLAALVVAVGPTAVVLLARIWLSGWHSRRVRTVLTLASAAVWATTAGLLAMSVGSWPSLTWAVRHGDTALAQRLLDLGFDPDGMDRRREVPLLTTAVQQGELEMATTLLRSGADPEVTDHGEGRPLMHACYRGDAALARLLLQAGADASRIGSDGWSALMAASKHNDPVLVRLLLDAGPQPPGVLEQALFEAVQAGDLERNRQLRESLERRNRRSPAAWKRMLIEAATSDSEEGVAEALDAGVPVDCEDDIGRSPLLNAARSRAIHAAALLLERGATVDAADHNRLTPLTAAAAAGDQAMVALLLDHGATIDARGAGGRTALLQAASAGQAATAAELLKRGASSAAVDDQGTGVRELAYQNGHHELDQLFDQYGAPKWRVPPPVGSERESRESLLEGRIAGTRRELLLAISAGDSATVDRLLRSGEDVNAHDRATNGGTALTWAAYCGQLAVLRQLLEAGADIDQASYPGVTALMEAAKAGRPEVVELLLDSGAAVDSRSEAGWTALMWAAERGDTAIVTLLLDHGADPTLSDQAGRTAVSVARAGSHEAVVRLVEAAAIP